MIIIDRVTNRLLKILLILASTILFFYLFPHIKNLIKTAIVFLLPFLLGFIFAFIFSPLVDYFEIKKVRREATSIIILILVIAVIVTICFLLIPTIIKESQKLVINLPNYLNNFEDLINSFLLKFKITNYKFNITAEDIVDFFQNNKSSFMIFLTKIIQSTFSYIAVFIVTPILMLYFLIYYHKITDGLKKYFIEKKWDKGLTICEEVAKTMRSYFKGVLLVMIILTFLSTIGFLIIRLDLPLLWGLIIGITNIIPYIGPYIGGAIVGIFALSTVPDKIIFVIILIILLQFVESNFITPQIDSKSIKTNPILVIFFITLFGKLFGIIGMLFAIPILLTIQIIFKAKKLIK